MAHKILIIGPSWVGDTVMAQSLFKLVKQRSTDATIDVLAPAWTFSLLSRMPEVSETIAIPLTHGELKLAARYRLAKKLRARAYDQCIVLPNSLKSAIIPWLARIPTRTGWVGECRYLLLNDIRRLDKKKYSLMVEQYLALGVSADEALPDRAAYLPSFYVSDAASEAVLSKHKPLWRGRPVLMLCPGGEYGPSKRWPEAYFAEIANKKIAEGWDIWIVGSAKDKPIAEKIMALTEQRCDDLTGRVGLAETVDLFSLVSGIVTNDSGLMHVAAALNKPLVALYGSTSPAFTPPLSKTATILKLDLDCQPCFERTCPLGHHRCMRDLTPERVLAVMAEWGT